MYDIVDIRISRFEKIKKYNENKRVSDKAARNVKVELHQYNMDILKNEMINFSIRFPTHHGVNTNNISSTNVRHIPNI